MNSYSNHSRWNTLRGVRGWLFFFCLSITVLGPAYAAFGLYRLWTASVARGGSVGRSGPVVALASVGAVEILISVAVGIYLFCEGRMGRTVAIAYLLAGVPITWFSYALAFEIGRASHSGVHTAEELVLRACGGTLMHVVWLIYWLRSKRVRATYAT